MENIKNLTVVFSGNTTDLSAAFTKVAGESEALNGKLKALGAESETMGAKFGGAFAAMAKAGVIAGVVVAGAAVKMAADFQQQMTYIRTDAGDTTDNINQMGQAILHMTSQFDSTTLAKGMYHLASLGLRGADALNALNTAQKMAAVGGANLEDTTNALGGALVSGIRGVQDYSSAAGTLDAIIGAGNMRMEDLTKAIGTGVLPVFKNAGLSITDFGAVLATLTDNAQPADQAATHLRMTIALMEAPSQKATKILESLGMTQNQLGMDMRTKGLVPALQDLKKHLLDTYGTTNEGKVKMAQALTEMFGGGKSSAAIQILIDQLDRVGNKEKQIGQQTGEFANKFKEQMMTPMALAKTAVNKVKSAMDEMGIAMNNFTISHGPKVVEALKKIGDILVSHLGPSLKALGKTITADVIPTIRTFWKDYIEPLMPVLGTLLVAAIWAVTNTLNILLKAFGVVMKFIDNNKPLVFALAGAFAFLAGAMAFNAVFNALAVGFATLTSVTIPSVMASVSALRGLIMSPMAFGAIAIGAAIFALDQVYNAANRAKQAVDAATNARVSSGNSAIAGIKNAEADYAAGKISKTVEMKQIGIYTREADDARNNATGTSYFPGGRTWVGEKGPELLDLPRGSQITNHQDSMKQAAGNRTVNIGTIILGSADAVKEMFSQLDRDNILVSKGLSPARGM